ncbi:hypothetical protein CJU89_3797 [Yarrowia sp. B02]|nr:hypothetical protein CJU89_3797 [Yarrowia sp. B02]
MHSCEEVDRPECFSRSCHSEEEFDTYLAEQELCSQCEVDGLGTVYFVFRDASKEHPGERNVHALFFDQDIEAIMESECFLLSTNGPLSSFAISAYCYLFCDGKNTLLCQLDSGWSLSYTVMIPSDKMNEVANFLSGQTSVNRDGLRKLRYEYPSDFTIKCAGGEEIAVHKAVLSSVWPFCKSMLESDMKEVSENTLELDYPKATVEGMVKYLYGEKLDMSGENAIELFVLGQMYELPELMKLSKQHLNQQQPGMKLQEALWTWRKCYEAKNETLRALVAEDVHKLLAGVEDFANEVRGMSKEEMMFLMQDLSVFMVRKKRKIK